MEVKPGYQQTEVGVIPEEWKVKSLRDVAQIRSGIAKNANTTTTDPVLVHYLRVANVQDGFLDLSEMSRIEVSRSDLQRFAVLRGDVLMNEGGDRDKLGRGSIWRGEFQPCIHQNHVFVVRCGRSVIPDYLTIWSAGSTARRYFLVAGKQTTNLASINKTALGELPVLVPNLPEQRAIATALSDVDGLLGGLDRLIAKKRDLKQAAMQQLLTGQTRLTGFHGEWEVKPLGELIFRLKKTTRPSSSGRAEGAYPFFTNTAKPVDKFLDEADFDTEAIIANTGGEAYFNYYNGNFAAMADCFVFKASLVTLFLYYFLKSVERAVNDNGFTGSGIKHLDKKFFYQMEVRCPAELPEQTAIATVLSEMDRELAVLEQRREKTRALKQAMMQELLTGKIRLL